MITSVHMAVEEIKGGYSNLLSTSFFYPRLCCTPVQHDFGNTTTPHLTVLVLATCLTALYTLYYYGLTAVRSKGMCGRRPLSRAALGLDSQPASIPHPAFAWSSKLETPTPYACTLRVIGTAASYL